MSVLVNMNLNKMKCGHVLLLDTSGSFKLAVRLPTKNYQHRPGENKHQRYYKRHRKLCDQRSKDWRNRNRDYVNRRQLDYLKNLPFEKWQQYRDKKRKYMKKYYQTTLKERRQNKKKQN